MINLKDLKSLAFNYSVLYVEDHIDIAKPFKNYLSKLFKSVDYVTDGEKGLEYYKKNSYDLVITDIKMPNMDGLKMSEKIKQINSEQNILITSAYSDTEKFIKSIKIGVDGYIIKPVDYDELNQILLKTVKRINAFKENELYKNNLKAILKRKTDDNLTLTLEKIDNYEKTLYALIDIIESRDTYTGKHSRRVAEYSKLIAKKLDFRKEECDEIYRAGILHDIGKIAIPDSLLLKPGSLNFNEYNLIKEHVNIGFHMLDQVPMFKKIARIINCHHERLDGSGYPNALKEDEIPFESNIMALADSFDAMTTNRIYKGRKSVKEALNEIKSLSGIHFKKEIVDVALEVLKDIKIDNNITQLPQNTLEEERFSYFYKDPLTEAFNEKYLDFILSKNQYEKKYVSINLLYFKNFSNINKKFGWKKGNEILIEVKEKLQELYSDFIIFRVHGDDFVLLCKNGNHFDSSLIEKIKESIDDKYINEISINFKTLNILENDIVSFEKLEETI